MLQLSDIQKNYGPHHVFSIAELTLLPGIYWLKGANGAGKSTLLKILAGLIPFKGGVLLNNQYSLRKDPVAYRKLVNHAPAEPLYPSFITGTELLEFTSGIKQGTTTQAELIKKSLGIGDYLQQQTGSYSSGMLKKLSLLLAFTGQPQWILLDEPLTTLDQVSQQALCELIMQLHHLKQVSFIITSHHDIEPAAIRFSQSFSLHDKQLFKSEPER
jgi:ABC-2 type transport system ATP-binding protein